MVPATAMGKVVGSAACFAGVILLATSAALFSSLFRKEWVQAKANANFKKRYAGHARALQEQDEIEALMSNFQDSMDELFMQVSYASAQAGHPPILAPLLMSIKEHEAALTKGASSYVYEALGQAQTQTANVTRFRRVSTEILPGALRARMEEQEAVSEQSKRQSEVHMHLDSRSSKEG